MTYHVFIDALESATSSRQEEWRHCSAYTGKCLACHQTMRQTKNASYFFLPLKHKIHLPITPLISCRPVLCPIIKPNPLDSRNHGTVLGLFHNNQKEMLLYSNIQFLSKTKLCSHQNICCVIRYCTLSVVQFMPPLSLYIARYFPQNPNSMDAIAESWTITSARVCGASFFKVWVHTRLLG